jgi:hypothetical protein
MLDLRQIETLLTRLSEDTRGRGNDLSSEMNARRADHLEWIDATLAILDRVRDFLIQERLRFSPQPKPTEIRGKIGQPESVQPAPIRRAE